MKYIPFAVAALAAVAGFFGLRVWIVLALALVNVALVSRNRLKQAREAPQQVAPPNILVEGAYLLVLQVLILGLSWLVGYFFANAIPI